MLPLFVCVALFASASTYSVPDPEFEVLKPSGLKVSIPDEEGIELFAFHGKVNEEMKGLEDGQMSKGVLTKENGKLTFYDKDVTLQSGDVVFYWLFVIHEGLGYQLDNGKFIYHNINTKEGDCPPGYKKKSLTDRGAENANNYGRTTGSDGMQRYPENHHYQYLHGSYPNYHRRSWHSHHRGYWHQYNQPWFNFWQRRGHTHWNGQNLNHNFNVGLGFTDVVHGDVNGHLNIGSYPFHTNVKRDADSEDLSDDSSEPEGSPEMESRFGSFPGFQPNYIRPHHRRPSQKYHRGHGYGYGYHHGNGYGFGNYRTERPYGPPRQNNPFFHGRPYPQYPGFGKGGHNKYDEYDDCEEEDVDSSNGEMNPISSTSTSTTEKTSPPVTETSATSTTKIPEVTSPKITTSTSTVPTSTFPQIDIRFGGS